MYNENYMKVYVCFLQYIRGLRNFKAEQPHQHAMYYTSVLLSEQKWTKEELLDATDGRHERFTVLQCFS